MKPTLNLTLTKDYVSTEIVQKSPFWGDKGGLNIHMKKLLVLSLSVMLFTLTVSAQGKPKNVVLLIGDGMGLAQIYAGMVANGNKLQLERSARTLYKYRFFKNLFSKSFYYRFGCRWHGFGLWCENKKRNDRYESRFGGCSVHS